MMDDSQFYLWQGWEIFIFFKNAETTLGPIQPTSQWVPEGSFLNGTQGLGHAANHLQPSTFMAKNALPHIPSWCVQGKLSLPSDIKIVN